MIGAGGSTSSDGVKVDWGIGGTEEGGELEVVVEEELEEGVELEVGDGEGRWISGPGPVAGWVEVVGPDIRLGEEVLSSERGFDLMVSFVFVD